MRDGELNCVAQRVVGLVDHFDGAPKGQGLTPKRRQLILDWETRVRESGATIADVVGLEKVTKWAIIIKDIAGVDIYNICKYQSSRWNPINLIAHNGHSWEKDLCLPQLRTVHDYQGDTWQAIKRVTQGKPIAVFLLGVSEDEPVKRGKVIYL